MNQKGPSTRAALSPSGPQRPHLRKETNLVEYPSRPGSPFPQRPQTPFEVPRPTNPYPSPPRPWGR